MVLSRPIDKPFYIAGALELRWLAAKHAGDARSTAWGKEARAFGTKVYRQKDYDALPDFALLPGEIGFDREYPHLELPDDLLAAVPPQLETLEAIANERFDDLL